MPASRRNRAIALSCGDLAGIGIEIAYKAWCQLRGTEKVFFLIGDPESLSEGQAISEPAEAAEIFATKLPILPCKQGENQIPDVASGWASLDHAIDLVLAGEASALVSNPVNKAHLARLGFPDVGQTEYLAKRCGQDSLMMLATENMRCALVTTHLPVREIASALSTEKIIRAGRILEKALMHDFGISKPRIGVAALNPHAGDKGVLGDEEQRVIEPACQALGEHFSKPYPADRLFTRKNFDAFLCMYHDQALIPIKMHHPSPAVNITLGLPIIRTSPDHGTALDIAGRNLADPSSLVLAIETAAQLVARRYGIQ